jgi:hypothetical protein
MVTTKRVLSLFVIASSAFGMVSCDSTPSVVSSLAPAANHNVLLASGSGQSAPRGQALPNPIVAKVVDASGNPVANEYVLASVASGGGTVTVPVPKSDRNGNVTILWSLGSAIGADILNVSISDSNGNWTNSPNFNVTAIRILSPASSANSSIVGTGPIIANGVTTSTITVTLLDANRQPLTGVIPTFSASGTNTYFPCSPVNSLGVSTCTMSSSTIGTKTLSITSPLNMTSGTVKFISGSPSLLTLAGNTNNLLSVLLKDAYSNVVSAQQIDWSVTLGGGTLTGPSSTTDATGTASNTFSSASSGIQTIMASVHGYPQVLPVTFSFDFGTWTFQSGTTGAYTLGNNIDFTAGNVCELTPINSTDNSAANFTSGTALGMTYGTLSDGVSQGFKLGLDPSATCNGTITGCPNAELDSTWAPHWSNLVALWHLNDVHGASTVIDSSTIGTATGSPGNTNLGVLGKLNGAANLAGSSQGITITSSNLPEGASPRSVSVWVFPNTATGLNTIFSYGQNSTNHAFGLFFNNQNAMYSGWGGSGDFVGTLPLTLSAWNHIALTYDGTKFTLYVNGVLDSTSAGTPGTIGANARIGDWLGTGSIANASIDELAVWNTALSAADVTTIYKRQNSFLLHSGMFTSRVMDAMQALPWTSLSWLPTLPFGKELPDNAASETISSYPLLADSTLMTGNVGLWHLDEPAGTTAAASVIDKSGNGNNGTPTAVTFGQSGKLGTAASFANSAIQVADSPSLELINTMTISVWVNPTTLAQSAIVQKRSLTNYSSGFNYALWLNDSAGHLIFQYYDTNYETSTSTGTIPAGVWSHVVVVYDKPSNTCTFYINGVAAGSSTITGSMTNVGNAPLEMGGYSYNGVYNNSFAFKGFIDEVGIWNRSLSSAEAQQLYQRGASRVKFQVQTCAQSNCSDGIWQGPDGTSSSYYTELDNNSIYNKVTNLPSGNVNVSLPSMTFANFATPTPAPNRYFQYRMFLESDVASTALMPEVKSISIGPKHYDGTSPSMIGSVGVPMPVLTSFAQTLGSNGCSSATYNLGIGTSSASAIWYYWNGSAWAVAGGTTSTSSAASAINTNLASFPVVGSNTVYFKAFLNSNGTTPCELQEVQLNGHN